MDLRTGAFAGGSAEVAVLMAAIAQIGRFYDVPTTVAASMTDAKMPDAQMGYEKGITSVVAGLAGANRVMEAAGMTASLMGVSYEALVIDNFRRQAALYESKLRDVEQALLADRDPAVRACAAASWRALVQRADDRALVDPDARVRVAAILAASAAGPNRLERRRIAWLAAADPDTRVRQAARHARRRRGRGQGIAWVHRVAEVEAPEGRSPWIAVTVDGGSPLSLPAVRIGGQLFAAAPGLGPVRLAE